MMNIIILNSHPIQYFAPLYRQMAGEGIPVKIWYCSDESVIGKLDKGFGTEVKWDIPLLEGYQFEFLKNNSWKPSIYNGFFGLINLGVIMKLYRQPRSVVLIHGWAYSTHLLTIFFGKLFGHKVCYRGETPLNQELKKNRLTLLIKFFSIRLMFMFVSKILYIGKQNKWYYEYLSINKKKLAFAPYSVDNDRFRTIYNSVTKSEARDQLNLDTGMKIILYSGKYISKKRPLDLLQSFQQLGAENVMLVFAGDGELRNEMENFIKAHSLEHKVRLTGFINQSKIPLYYRASDVFVMCSGIGETWGLSVNEAMNFGLPVIVSDTCGCAYDLVDEGVNGSVFETADIGQLTQALRKYTSLEPSEEKEIQKRAMEIMDQYSYRQVIDEIKSLAG
jgi:glycosyltransferase involved in cell wall biosynthesis